MFCVKTEQVENMKFLCLNINDDYNHDMGGCDRVDQLRIYYSLWSVKLATLISATGGNFSAIHVDYVDFVPELGWRFQSRNL